MLGTATFVILSNILPEKNLGFSLLILCIFFSNAIKAKMPDTPCAMNVAQATPATPIFIGPANIKSSAILVREEKIKKYNGVFESPRAVKTAVLILYINRNAIPAA